MNNLEALTKNWKQLLLGVVLILGILVAVYLVQTQKIIRSKASTDINAGLKVTDDSGQELTPVEENTYQTDQDHINVSIRNLQELTSP